MRKNYLRGNFVASGIPVIVFIKHSLLVLFPEDRAKHLAALLCVGCLVLGCDRNDTEPGLTSGCFEAASSKTLNENLNFVAIPDSVFEKQLISRSFDSDKKVNGKILMTDAKKVKKLYLGSQNFFTPGFTISNLSGIEYFSELEDLTINDVLEDSLDLSHNKKLTSFSYFGYSGVGGREFNRQYKTLEKIFFGKNDNLTTVKIGLVWLEELDISGLPKLTQFFISSEPLTTVYVASKQQKERLFNNQTVFTRSNQTVEYKVCNRDKQ